MDAPRRFTFPPEIRDMIVDILGGANENFTMRILAQTHSSFLPRCRYYLFSVLDLVPCGACRSNLDVVAFPHCQKKLENIANLFKNSPHLAIYVRRFTYWLPSHLAYDSGHLLIILGSLPRVQILELNSEHTISLPNMLVDRTSWPALPPTIRVGLEKALRSPSLVKLVINFTSDFPLNVLATCQNLSYLDLNHVRFRDIIDSDEKRMILRGPSLRLQTLKSFSSFPAIRTLTSSKFVEAGIIDLTHLTALSILDRDGRALRATATTLLKFSKCVGTLHYLVLDARLNHFCDILTSGVLKTLKVLKATIPFKQETPFQDPLLDLTDEIEKWGGKNALERIDIIVYIQKNMRVTLHSGSWKKLNNLETTQWFPFLKRVSLTIVFTSPSAQYIEVLEKDQATVFEKLRVSRKIVFKFKAETRNIPRLDSLVA
ncbi:hypothetical protein GALMADRAFT_456670 [Galerina marginata CBS 339.88]|uniref:F-box domain-containing protein n=1 Tax=Galerina marginata (strain CBS 339.88) TaxID=685588 RepID=A0A067TAJ5_GALM3|nr:hypothetical protein GALMADRAFT_456670 [Galerina marginata CBS 339.88]